MTAPCPFCGDERAPEPLPRWFNGSKIYHAECPCCGARGPYSSTQPGALTLWNNREAPGSSEAWRKQFEKIT